MPFITDGFGRTIEHGQEQLTAAEMRSLLMNDVKTKTSKKAFDDEPPARTKARMNLEDLLTRIGQSIVEEVKEVVKKLDEAKKTNEQYYGREKKTNQRNTFGTGNIIGLGKVIGEAMRGTVVGAPSVPNFMNNKQYTLDKKDFDLEKKWFTLFGKIFALDKKEFRLHYMEARQYGVLAGKTKETPRDAVDKQKTTQTERKQIAEQPLLTNLNRAATVPTINGIDNAQMREISAREISHIESLINVNTRGFEKVIKELHNIQASVEFGNITLDQQPSTTEKTVEHVFVQKAETAEAKGITQLFEFQPVKGNSPKDFMNDLEQQWFQFMNNEDMQTFMENDEANFPEQQFRMLPMPITVKENMLEGQKVDLAVNLVPQPEIQKIQTVLVDAICKGIETAIQAAVNKVVIPTSKEITVTSNAENSVKDQKAGRPPPGRSKFYAYCTQSVPTLAAATGGIVPGPRIRKDMVRADLPEGGFVLNRDSSDELLQMKKSGMVKTLLMPGELVFSPEEAQKIGYNKLHQMNDDPSSIQGYDKGGPLGEKGFGKAVMPSMTTLYRGLKTPMQLFDEKKQAEFTQLLAARQAWQKSGKPEKTFPQIERLKELKKIARSQYFSEYKHGEDAAEQYAGPGGYLVSMTLPAEVAKETGQFVPERGSFNWDGQDLYDLGKQYGMKQTKLPTLDEIFAGAGPHEKGRLYKMVAAMPGREINRVLKDSPIFTKAFRGWWSRIPEETKIEFVPQRAQALTGVKSLAEGDKVEGPEKPKSLFGKLKSLIGSVTDYADKKTDMPYVKPAKDIGKAGATKFQTFLEERYGTWGSKLILAAGAGVGWGATGVGAAFGVPVWLPGSTIWGALPFMAVTEIGKFLKGLAVSKSKPTPGVSQLPAMTAGVQPGVSQLPAMTDKQILDSVETAAALEGIKIPKIDVPQMAKGGIVKKSKGGTLVNVGEGGRDEAIIPLTDGGELKKHLAQTFHDQKGTGEGKELNEAYILKAIELGASLTEIIKGLKAYGQLEESGIRRNYIDEDSFSKKKIKSNADTSVTVSADCEALKSSIAECLKETVISVELSPYIPKADLIALADGSMLLLPAPVPFAVAPYIDEDSIEFQALANGVALRTALSKPVLFPVEPQVGQEVLDVLKDKIIAALTITGTDLTKVVPTKEKAPGTGTAVIPEAAIKTEMGKIAAMMGDDIAKLSPDNLKTLEELARQNVSGDLLAEAQRATAAGDGMKISAATDLHLQAKIDDKQNPKGLKDLPKEPKEPVKIDKLSVNKDDLCACFCECLHFEASRMIEAINATSTVTKALGKKVKDDAKTERKGKKGKGKEDLSYFDKWFADLEAWVKKKGKKDKNKYDGRRGYLFSTDRIANGIGDAIMSEKPVQKLLESSRIIGRGVGSLARGAGNLAGFAASFIPGVGPFLAAGLSGLGGMVAGLLEDIISALVRPIVSELDYFQDLRQTAFTSMGVNKGPIARGPAANFNATRAQEEALRAYQLTTEHFLAAGQNLQTLQQTQLRNLKRGIRDATTLNRVTVTGLNTSRMLGSNAEETANFFADMHQNLQMTTSDLAHWSVSLRDISRTTGLTGDNLLRVAKSSDQFMKNMRNSGTLTSIAGTNVTNLLAEATTTGTTEGMNRLMGTLSTSMLAGGGDDRTRNLVLAATGGREDLVSQVQTNTLMQNRQGIRDFAGGLRNVLNQWTAGRRIEDLTSEERATADAGLQTMYGVGIGELNLLIQNFMRASRSFAERYQELQPGQRLGTTGLGRTQLMINEQRQALEYTTINEYLSQFSTALDSAIESGDGLAGALQRFNSTTTVASGDFVRDMDALGLQTGINNQEALSGMLQRAITNINTRLRDVAEGSRQIGRDPLTGQVNIGPEIERAIADGPRGIQDLMARMTVLDQIATTRQKSLQDPISRIEDLVRQIEFHIRTFVKKFLEGAGVVIDSVVGEIMSSPFWQQFQMGNITEGFRGVREYIKTFSGRATEMIAEIDRMVDVDPITKNMMKVGVFIVAAIIKAIDYLIYAVEVIRDVWDSLQRIWRLISTNPIILAIVWLFSEACEDTSNLLRRLGINLSSFDVAVGVCAIGLLLFMTPLGAVARGLISLSSGLLQFVASTLPAIARAGFSALTTLGGGSTLRGAARATGGVVAGYQIISGGMRGYEDYDYDDLNSPSYRPRGEGVGSDIWSGGGQWRGAAYGAFTGNGRIEEGNIAGSMRHGAITGAAIGTMILPGYGTVVGGAAGALAGLVGEYAKAQDHLNREIERGTRINRRLFDLHRNEANRLEAGGADQGFAQEAYQNIAAARFDIDIQRRGTEREELDTTNLDNEAARFRLRHSIEQHADFIRTRRAMTRGFRAELLARERGLQQAIGQRLVDMIPANIMLGEVSGPQVREIIGRFVAAQEGREGDAARTDATRALNAITGLANVNLVALKNTMESQDRDRFQMQHLQTQMLQYRTSGSIYTLPSQRAAGVMTPGMAGGSVVQTTGLLGSRGIEDLPGTAAELNAFMQAIATSTHATQPALFELRRQLQTQPQASSLFQLDANQNITGVKRTETGGALDWNNELRQVLQRTFRQVDPVIFADAIRALQNPAYPNVTDTQISTFLVNTRTLNDNFNKFVAAMRELTALQEQLLGQSRDAGTRVYGNNMQGIQQQVIDIFTGQTGVDFASLASAQRTQSNLQVALNQSPAAPRTAPGAPESVVAADDAIRRELVTLVTTTLSGLSSSTRPGEAVDAIIAALERNENFRPQAGQVRTYMETPTFQNFIRSFITTRGQSAQIETDLVRQLRSIAALGGENNTVTRGGPPLYRVMAQEIMAEMNQRIRTNPTLSIEEQRTMRTQVTRDVLNKYASRYDPTVIQQRNAQQDQQNQDLITTTLDLLARRTIGRPVTSGEMQNAVDTLLPSLRTIVDGNQKQLTIFSHIEPIWASEALQRRRTLTGQLPAQLQVGTAGPERAGSGLLGLISGAQSTNPAMRMTPAAMRTLADELLVDYASILTRAGLTDQQRQQQALDLVARSIPLENRRRDLSTTTGGTGGPPANLTLTLSPQDQAANAADVELRRQVGTQYQALLATHQRILQAEVTRVIGLAPQAERASMLQLPTRDQFFARFGITPTITLPTPQAPAGQPTTTGGPQPVPPVPFPQLSLFGNVQGAQQYQNQQDQIRGMGAIVAGLSRTIPFYGSSMSQNITNLAEQLAQNMPATQAMPSIILQNIGQEARNLAMENFLVRRGGEITPGTVNNNDLLDAMDESRTIEERQERLARRAFDLLTRMASLLSTSGNSQGVQDVADQIISVRRAIESQRQFGDFQRTARRLVEGNLETAGLAPGAPRVQLSTMGTGGVASGVNRTPEYAAMVQQLFDATVSTAVTVEQRAQQRVQQAAQQWRQILGTDLLVESPQARDIRDSGGPTAASRRTYGLALPEFQQLNTRLTTLTQEISAMPTTEHGLPLADARRAGLVTQWGDLTRLLGAMQQAMATEGTAAAEATYAMQQLSLNTGNLASIIMRQTAGSRLMKIVTEGRRADREGGALSETQIRDDVLQAAIEGLRPSDIMGSSFTTQMRGMTGLNALTGENRQGWYARQLQTLETSWLEAMNTGNTAAFALATREMALLRASYNRLQGMDEIQARLQRDSYSSAQSLQRYENPDLLHPLSYWLPHEPPWSTRPPQPPIAMPMQVPQGPAAPPQALGTRRTIRPGLAYLHRNEAVMPSRHLSAYEDAVQDTGPFRNMLRPSDGGSMRSLVTNLQQVIHAGSIFTHDTTLERLLSDMLFFTPKEALDLPGMVEISKNIINAVNRVENELAEIKHFISLAEDQEDHEKAKTPEIQPLLTGLMNLLDPELEARRHQMTETKHDSQEDTAANENIKEIEEHTDETKKDTKKIVALLDMIRKLLTSPKKSRKGGSDNHEDIFEEALYDAVLDTTWMASQVSDGTSTDVDIDRT